jgi:hypothetical protein
MVTGVTTAWGFSPSAVAEFSSNLGNALTYQLGLTSLPPKFVNGEFVSPITPTNNQYNTYNFGRSKFGMPLRKLTYTPPQQGPCAPVRPCNNDNKTLYAKYSVVYDCNYRSNLDQHKQLVLNGKIFKNGSSGYYNEQRQAGRIIGMGCSQIIILTASGTQRRIPLEKFFKYNY